MTRPAVTSRKPLSVELARALTEEVRRDAAALWAKLLELYEGGAHITLGYSSWGAYFEAEFGRSGNYGYRLLKSAEVIAELPKGKPAPASERVARELAPVLHDGPGRVAEAWDEAIEHHGPAPTADQVREVVRGAAAPVPAESPADRCVLPDDLQAALRREFRFDGKAEQVGDTVRVGSHFEAGVRWVNPPARDVARWVRAARDFASAPGFVAVCVVPVDTTAAWWWACCRHGEVRFLRKPLDWEQAGALAAAIVVFGRRACVRWWELPLAGSTAPAACVAAGDDETRAQPEAAEAPDASDAELARLQSKFPELDGG